MSHAPEGAMTTELLRPGDQGVTTPLGRLDIGVGSDGRQRIQGNISIASDFTRMSQTM